MEIISGLHQVDGVQGNCFLVERDDSLVLVDAGLPGSGKKILGYVGKMPGKSPADLHTIIVTHHHLDHTGGLADVKRATGAKIAVHRGDADYVAGRLPCPPLKGAKGKIVGLMSHLMPVEPVEPDILLDDGDMIAGMRCVHTPGHTPGSISLLDPNLRALFCGDTLTTKKGSIGGPPASATVDMDLAMESAKIIAGLDFDILLSGHGIPITASAREKTAAFAGLQR